MHILVLGFIVFLGISLWLSRNHPSIYQFFANNGGNMIAVGFLIVFWGVVAAGACWLLWFVLSVIISPFRRLFRKPYVPPPAPIPTSQWPFHQRSEYATKEVHEILQKIKEENVDGYRIVTDDMFSAMRVWALDIFHMYLRKNGDLGDAYNYVFIILLRHIEHLPENIPPNSYLNVPLKELMVGETGKGAYDVPFDKLYDALVPYAFEQDLRYQGVWIPTRPGSGKSNLLHCMLEDAMPEVARHEASVVIVDSKSNDKNSLIENWPHIDFEHEWGIKNVYYFQASDKLAINVFGLGDIDQIVPLFEYMLTDLIGFDLTGHQKYLLTNCLHVIKVSDAPSILALNDLLSSGLTKHLPAIYRTRPLIQEFFLKSKPELVGRHTRNVTDFESVQYRDTRRQVLTRLHALLSFSDKLYDTLVSTKTEIDLRKIIDQGSVVIINAKLSDLGSKGSELWQRWWTMMLLDAGRKRKRDHPVYVMLDEAHRGIARDTKISEALEELRAAKLAITISHQGDWQIQDPGVLRSLQGLSAIILRATGERGVFNAKVYEKTLTVHVKEADVRYRRRITHRQERTLASASQQFSNPDAPPLMPLLTFIGPLPEEPVYPDEVIYPEAAEPEPEPFEYDKKTTITDAEYEVLDDDAEPEPYDPAVKDMLRRYRMPQTPQREREILKEALQRARILPASTNPKSLPPRQTSIHDGYLC